MNSVTYVDIDTTNELSHDELEILHYVSGYLARRVLRAQKVSCPACKSKLIHVECSQFEIEIPPPSISSDFLHFSRN